MAELNLQIQTRRGEVSATTFREALRHTVFLLDELDSGISRMRGGTLLWYVNRLSSNGLALDSSLIIHLASHVKRLSKKKQRRLPPDISSRVTSAFVSALEDLEQRAVVPSYLSEIGLEKAHDLADLIRQDGAMAFRFAAANRSVEVTERTADNVNKLLPITRTAIGSVEGRLEGLNMHKKLTGIVYHAVTNRPITCEADEQQFNKMKDAFGKRVTVFGELKKNINGDTVRVAVQQFDVIERNRFTLPGDVTTLGVPDFETAESTEEYLRRIRGG